MVAQSVRGVLMLNHESRFEVQHAWVDVGRAYPHCCDVIVGRQDSTRAQSTNRDKMTSLSPVSVCVRACMCGTVCRDVPGLYWMRCLQSHEPSEHCVR
jgi:hypothetical protein